MQMSCHSIDVQAILPDQSKEVGSENCFRHWSNKNYSLKLTVAEIPMSIVIKALPGEVNNFQFTNIFAR